MGKKIFVSYKYGDNQVRPINGDGDTTVRNYIDLLQEALDDEDHINKGEKDDEDLSSFKDATIASKLRDKIYDTSMTIIVISKGMKSGDLHEDDQWIPWEVSYSLSEYTRSDKTSRTNGVLAVVLPDENNSYEYFIIEKHCPNCNTKLVKTNVLFKILRDNMFNIKKPVYTDCSDHVGGKSYKGDSSYIRSIKWDYFIDEIPKYIEICERINGNINDYNISKSVT